METPGGTSWNDAEHIQAAASQWYVPFSLLSATEKKTKKLVVNPRSCYAPILYKSNTNTCPGKFFAYIFTMAVLFDDRSDHVSHIQEAVQPKRMGLLVAEARGSKG